MGQVRRRNELRVEEERLMERAGGRGEAENEGIRGG